MINTYFDKRELKYIKRKERLDKDFVWTNEDLQKLGNLNADLLKMQDALVDEIKSTYDLFSKLEKNGMSFLHGFKVIGNIFFEKEIINDLYELDKPTKAQKAIIDKWDNITWNTSDEIEAW